uniref:Uncharacterized protein n=1 Tax=Kalanchoe fedtschenkoi TaxID=63787 RepID=A0A7N0TRG5_KALFE
MVPSGYRGLVLLLCIAFMLQPATVSCLRNLDLAQRAGREDNSPIIRVQRLLKDLVTGDLNTKSKPAPINRETDPNQASKRRVHKGPDPIHNRT